MLIIDGDYPMAHGAMELDRDLTLTIEDVRAAEPGISADPLWPDADTMASLPEMRRGGIAVALVKVVGRIRRPGSPVPSYRTGDLAYAAAQRYLAYYRILEKRGEARILQTRQSFAEHMRIWEAEAEAESATATEDRGDLPVGMVLGMEGADPILWPEHVHEWWDSGLRVVSLAHYGISTYAHGTSTGTEGGLLPPARELLREMEAAGMILDLTHSSDESVRQSLDLFSGPVLASHQNCRALVPGERQFPDELLRAIIERGGVVGVSMDTWMLYRAGVDWDNIPPRRSVFTLEEVTLDDLADHIDHLCQLAGDARHAAIGGDTDGQGGKDGAPLEVDTVADYQKVSEVLERRGYGTEDIAAVMHGNWQRFFETWLPA